MKIRQLMFLMFRAMVRFLWGTKLSKLPLVYRVFKSLHAYLKPKSVQFIDVEGHKIYMDVENGSTVDVYVFQPGKCEKLIRELFKREVKPGMVVIDLGAHIGYHTLLMAKLVGEKGRVFAFEPSPVNYAILSTNIAVNGYKNVIPIQKAVSNETGRAKLFLDDYNSGLNRLYEPCGESERFVTVETVTLDEYFKDKDLHIGFIKMDIEGSEMAALDGMANLIEKNRNLKLATEFNPEFLRRAGASPEKFLNKLTEYDFEIYHINEKRKSIEAYDAASLLEAYKGGRGTNLFCIRRSNNL